MQVTPNPAETAAYDKRGRMPHRLWYEQFSGAEIRKQIIEDYGLANGSYIVLEYNARPSDQPIAVISVAAASAHRAGDGRGGAAKARSASWRCGDGRLDQPQLEQHERDLPADQPGNAGADARASGGTDRAEASTEQARMQRVCGECEDVQRGRHRVAGEGDRGATPSER